MAATIQTIQKPTKARALDTSGNNNHGQIYSGRALEFDGVGDYITTTMSTSMDEKSAITLSLWVKVDIVPSGDEYILQLPEDVAGTNGCGIRADANNFIFDILTHSDSTAGDESITYDYQLNTWYRLVLTYDGTTGKGYVNGVLADSDTVTVGTGIKHASGEVFIGDFSDEFSRPFAGKISNFQVWDATWTAADALYDYNNPEQLALNNTGTSLTNSNLKIWYPMNDGHRGQQSYILDASNVGLGTDIATNGGFDSDTGWTKGTGWTISGGQAHCDGSQTGNSSFYQDTSRISGQTYKLTYTISNYVAGNVNAHLGGNNVGGQSANGDYVHYLVAGGDNDDINMYANSTFNATIDNVVIKPVNQKNHATTVFYGDELNTQANAVTPSGSSASEANDTANWTNVGMSVFASKTSNNTQGTYSLRMDSDGDGDHAHTNFTTTIVGRTYRFQWDRTITNHDTNNRILFKIGESANDDTNGSLDSWVSNEATSAVIGEYKDFVATATTTFFTCLESGSGNDANLYLDNLSLKEVGLATGWTDADQQLQIPQTALQSYNQLAWFDGVGDYVELDLTNSYLTASATISAWVFVNSYPATGQAGIWGNFDAQVDGFAFGIDASGDIYYRMADNDDGGGVITDTLTSGAAIPLGVLTHIIMVFDKVNAKIIYYKNGELEETVSPFESTPAVLDTDSSKVWLGRFPFATTSYLNGAINEVSCWNTVLSQAEINELYNDGKALDALTHSNSNLLGYWRNNGLAPWEDLKSSNDGAVTASETMLITAGADATRDSQGFLMNRQRLTNSLNLTTLGASNPDAVSYATIPRKEYDIDGSATSFSFWYKPESTNEAAILASSTTSSTSMITVNPANKVTIEGDTNNKYARNNSSYTALTLGEWYHFAITCAGDGSVILYKDGASLGTTQYGTGSDIDVNITLDQIGNASTSSKEADGQIDDLAIYEGKALTAAEVKRNYNAGKRSHR